MIELATAANRAYLPYCATLIRSCLDHHGPALRVRVLHDQLTQAELAPLIEMVRDEGALIDAAPVRSAVLDEVPSAAQFGGRTHLLRLLLPEVMSDASRVLYLDADTFVAAPLDELWTTPFTSEPIAAVANVVEPAMRAHVTSLVSDAASFFNSGVLLIDLDAARAESSFSRVLSEVGARPASPWPDQDALNVVFAGRWKHLHPRWNAMNSLWSWPQWAEETFGQQAAAEARHMPAILHFEGPLLCKPWHYLSTHVWRERYRSTLRRTAWADQPLEERTLGTRVISKLPARLRVPAYWRWRSSRLSGGP